MANSSLNDTGAGSSSHESAAKRGRNRVLGIPRKCWCGSGIIERISTSFENPYRIYYRCGFAHSNKLRHDQHTFKWVDEAYLHQIEHLDYQVSVLEEELRLMKLTGGLQTTQGESSTDYVIEEVMNDFEVYVLGNVEEVMAESIKKMRGMMAVVFGSCVLLVVIAMVIKK